MSNIDIIAKQSVEQADNTLDNTLTKAINYALDIQYDAGYWYARLDSNSTMEAEFLLLLHFLDIQDRTLTQKIRNQILEQQNADGTWGIYYQGPGDLSTTVECYFALKLTGSDINEPNLVKAKQFILAKGGIPKVRVFTKIWLALFGLWPWECIPLLLPEIMLLPNRFAFNIYELSSWARATIVPLTLVMTEKPICPIPESANIPELFPDSFDIKDAKTIKPKALFSWRGIFWLIDKLLHSYERLPIKPFRKTAMKRAFNWILDHQEADGSWSGIQPPWVYSLIALKISGYDLDHPVMKKGIEGFKGFYIEHGDKLQVQACVSPVWDTCLMMIALQDAGVKRDHPALQLSCDWLIKEQILVGGDWQIKNPKTPPGGWAFEFANDKYPDIDDTAEILIAILRTQFNSAELTTKQQQSLARGREWLLSMQSKNGGWAAFDKDNDNFFLTKIPFFDFGEVLDPPSVDVTAHVLEALGRMNFNANDPRVQKALKLIYKEQEPDGSWFGRWGVNYVYGIGAVLPALEAIGEDMSQPAVRRAVSWILDKQNADGGWGESCASYVDSKQHGKGPSTASQTAWALLGLFAAGEWENQAVTRGIDYLCQTMLDNGTWDEPYYTGCGFPGYGVGKRLEALPKPGEAGYQGEELPAGFMINYNLYRHYWPLMALGRYQNYVVNNITRSVDN